MFREGKGEQYHRWADTYGDGSMAAIEVHNLDFIVVVILSQIQTEARFRYLGVPEFWFNLAFFLTLIIPKNRTKIKLK